LRQQSVFRGAKERSLRAGQENRGHGHGQAAHREARNGKKHHRDLENFRADGDGAFAVAVGEVAAGHREENEGEGEERADDEDFGFTFVGGEVVADDEKNDEVLQRVIVERALKLRAMRLQNPRRQERGASVMQTKPPARESVVQIEGRKIVAENGEVE